jgi:hypothetical protein
MKMASSLLAQSSVRAEEERRKRAEDGYSFLLHNPRACTLQILETPFHANHFFSFLLRVMVPFNPQPQWADRIEVKLQRQELLSPAAAARQIVSCSPRQHRRVNTTQQPLRNATYSTENAPP